MVAAGVMGGGVTAAALLGTGLAGREITRTVMQPPRSARPRARWPSARAR